MKNPLVVCLFVVVALAQLSVPGTMIWRHEHALRAGEPYKFRTAPVDPYDAFRGRYVALGFDQNLAPWKDRQPPQPGQKVYAVIEQGPDGFARFAGATTQRPEGGGYITAHVSWAESSNSVRLTLPFDRFYMEETLAPAAEQAYRQHSRRGQQDAYVIVRIRNGAGVIENLYIGGQPIAEFIHQELK